MTEDKEVQQGEIDDFGHTATARPERGAVPISLGDGLILPNRYRARVTLYGNHVLGGLEFLLRVEVDSSGEPSCKELTIRQDADEGERSAPAAITWETLRALSISRLLAIANEAAFEKVEYVGERLYLAPMTGDEVEDVRGRYVGRRKRVPAQELEQVAAIYRDALKAGLPPTKTVHERMHISRSHAGRLVMRARDYGLLGPALGTRPGEEEQ